MDQRKLSGYAFARRQRSRTLDNLVCYYDALEVVLIERGLQDEYADFLRTIRKCRGKLRRINKREYRLEQFRAMRSF